VTNRETAEKLADLYFGPDAWDGPRSYKKELAADIEKALDAVRDEALRECQDLAYEAEEDSTSDIYQAIRSLRGGSRG
jgi:hypothetical protein